MSIAIDSDAFLASLRSRDPSALELVVREYLPHVVRAARAAGLAPHEADDAAQATFVTFFEKCDTFEGRSHIRTWLFGILYRKIMEMRRVIERDRQTDDIDDVMESRFDATGHWSTAPRRADEEVYARQVREGIADCLEAVSEKQRMAFVLREVEGLSTPDICKILEVSDTNFGVLLYRVRNRLRECLEARGVTR